jgi:hypothetical protein
MRRPDRPDDFQISSGPTPDSRPLPDRTIDPGKSARNRLLIGGALLTLAVLYASLEHGEIKHPAGVLIREEPYQTLVDNPAGWQVEEFQIKPLAHIRLRARVLSAERYWFDEGSKLSPIDFALGWGPMSDQRVLDRLSFSQGGRWYHWRPKDKFLPISGTEIARYSANMHMIPSTAEMKKRLRSVRAGDIIQLAGDLVLVETKKGWRWRSSLSRTDTGNGACELVWVKDLSIR